MRAIITIGYLLFLVMSAPLLEAGIVLLGASPASGIVVVWIWSLVMMPFTGALCVVWLGDERPRHIPSDIYFPKRNYISWNSIHGWPRADNLRYECGLCHQALPSQTTTARECGCGNLYITPDHIGAQSPMKVLLFDASETLE